MPHLKNKKYEWVKEVASEASKRRITRTKNEISWIKWVLFMEERKQLSWINDDDFHVASRNAIKFYLILQKD